VEERVGDVAQSPERIRAPRRRVREGSDVAQIDLWLPRYEFEEQHAIVVRAPIARVRRALAGLDFGRIPLVRALMAIRRLPGRLMSPRAPHATHATRATAPTTAVAPSDPGTHRSGLAALDGFLLLADEPDEIVLGVTGRFWKIRGEILASERASFRAPPPEGTARAAMNVRLTAESPHRTRVATETRIHCADDATRRAFGRYWRLIRLGSGATRIALLRALRRAAETDEAASGP